MGQDSYYNPWNVDDDEVYYDPAAATTASIDTYDTNASMIEMHLLPKFMIGFFATIVLFLSIIYTLFLIELDNKDNVIVVERHGPSDTHDLKLSATSSTDETHHEEEGGGGSSSSSKKNSRQTLRIEHANIVYGPEDFIEEPNDIPGGPTKKMYIQNDTKVSLTGTTAALTLLCYLLLVALPESGHFILSVIGFLIVMGIFLKPQIKSQIRTDRYDRIVGLFTLILFLAASLCLATYAGIALNEGTIYQGNARIIGFSESDYENEGNFVRRTDLMVSWGGEWGCPGMEKECYAEVKGTLCQVTEEEEASRRTLLTEEDLVDQEEVDILAEDYVDLIELSEETGERDDDEFLKEEFEVVENLEEDLEQAYYEAAKSGVIQEAAAEYTDDIYSQTLVEEELIIETVEEEAVEGYYEAVEIIAEEEEYEQQVEEAKTEEEEEEEEKEELEEELEELKEEFEELKEELREQTKEAEAQDEEIIDEAFDVYYEALENEYEAEEIEDPEESETIIELDEEIEDMADAAYYEAIKNEELEEEVEELKEELLEEEEEEVEEELKKEIASYSFDDDSFEDDYWMNQNWSSTWGDYQCNGLFDFDFGNEDSYDESVPPGDDNWPFINIYGKCNTCDAYIVDYFSTEHFQAINAYQQKGLRFGIAGLISFALTMLLVYRHQKRPENERQSELLETGDGIFT